MVKKARILRHKFIQENEGMKAHVKDMQNFFGLIANHVKSQKARIGGNFVIAHAVPYKAIREHIRTILPEVTFIVLTLTKEQCCQILPCDFRHF